MCIRDSVRAFASGVRVSDGATQFTRIFGASSAASATVRPSTAPLAMETEARRKSATAPDLPPELGGRKQGLEPVRYGDWEKKGIAVDF